MAALPVAARQQMAAVVLGEAAARAGDAGATLVDRVVARQAAHHVRGDLADRGGLPAVEIGLICGLETLGDRQPGLGRGRSRALPGLAATGCHRRRVPLFAGLRPVLYVPRSAHQLNDGGIDAVRKAGRHLMVGRDSVRAGRPSSRSTSPLRTKAFAATWCTVGSGVLAEPGHQVVAVQAALQAGKPSRPPRRGPRVPAADCEPLF